MSLPIIKNKSRRNQIKLLEEAVATIKRQHSNFKIIQKHKLRENKLITEMNETQAVINRQRVRTQSIEFQNKTHRVVTGKFIQPTKILVVSAMKWVIFDRLTQKYSRGFKADQTHRMHGFTKLLVFYCVYVITVKYSIDITKFDCIGNVYSELAAGIRSLVNRQDLITIQTLLYLMVLQENDQAEYLLALNLGAYLYKKQQSQVFSVYDIKKKEQKIYVSTFQSFMNSTSTVLGLEKTKIRSLLLQQRGQNTTCSSDIALLTIQCLKIHWYTKILNTSPEKPYRASIKFVDDEGEYQKRQILIENHNLNTRYLPYKMVYKHNSLKFSHSSCSVLYEDNQYSLIIVLLNCHSVKEMYKDIQKAIEWFLKKSQYQDSDQFN